MAAQAAVELAVTVLVILAVYIGVAVIWWTANRRKSLNLLKRYDIPGPEPGFFAGNLPQLKAYPTPNDLITSWLEKYGNVFGYYVGGDPYIVIKDQKMLNQIFCEGSVSARNFMNRPFMNLDMKPLNKSLLALRDKRWTEVRQILSPTFSALKMKLMTYIVNKKVDTTLNIVGQKAEKKEMFDMYEVVQALTLDVIADCALAMKTQCQENPKDIFLVAVRDFFRYVNSKANEYAIMFPFIASVMTFISNYLTAGQMTALIVNNLESVISTRRKNPETKSLDILQLMLDHAEDEKHISGMTDEEIIANAYVFLLGGFETTATSLAFTFYLLIKHPDVQERLFQEIQEKGDATYDTIQSFHYLDQVFSESLRIFPPVVAFVSRACEHDTQIESYTIPKGSTVLAPVWDIHHDSELWPDPWTFNPDRFAPGNNPHKYNTTAFMPFGLGRRHCIGQRFALLEAKLTIFRLVKAYKFEACEKTEDPLNLSCPTVIINPANGIYARAIPRTATI